MTKKEKRQQKRELKLMKKATGHVTSFWQDFIAFIKRGNALALAIGVVVGGAFTAIVNSFNKDIIMPLIGGLFGKNDLSSLYWPLWNAEKVVVDGVVQLDQYGNELYTNAIYYGRLLQAAIDFILIAFILFIILRITNAITNAVKNRTEKVKSKFEKKEEEVPAPAPEPVIPEDVKLLTEIRDLLVEQSKTKE